MSNVLHIKNMVCPRCITAVIEVFSHSGLPVKEVSLGEVELNTPLENDERKVISDRLSALGFELLEEGRSSLVSKIKTLIIDQVHHNEEALSENFSTFLSEQLTHDYSYLSRLFSSVEGITIERFITRQRVEKVKELLFYDELSLKEIAYRLNYSSPAYLSTQFKKEIGMTPSEFKRLHRPGHQSLDSI
ncbi:MAG: helix-turn-helix transcriptional regulator [Flavobacteriia bacterium]|nr:helix-turn-helix transcriptional regulator [Flavobacteriia bacterium]